MNPLDKKKIRLVAISDWSAFEDLEKAVWEKRNIEKVTGTLFERWVEQGIFLAYFEDGGRMVGYVYAERASFVEIPPFSNQIVLLQKDYRDTEPVLLQNSNAIHGVSMAASLPGVGNLLLNEIIEYAKRLSLEYFISMARLAGLLKFTESNPSTRELDDLTMATLYAIQAVRLVNEELIGPPLSLLNTPIDFPILKKRDPVVSRFARIGKSLWGVGRSSFEDQSSLSFSALMVLKF